MGEKDPKISKGRLGIALSQISGFEDPKVMSEQYTTDPEIGAEILWNVGLKEDLTKVSDLGCGTGLLGIGLLLLGAKKVHFVDSDPDALRICKENLAKAKSEYSIEGEAIFHEMDVSEFLEQVELVVQNPPFGIKVRNADRKFLQKAMDISKVIYSFHKSESLDFISKLSRENGFLLTEKWDFSWPLKATYSFHSKRMQHIPVTCFRLEKDKN